jgi:6-pyruvoyltetrahydropterin/6-carboxytetrahydropterin synthase
MIQQFYPQTQHSYKYELNKDMNFSAAHFIPSDSAGKCRNIHGHTYFVNVTVVGDKLDECGFLVNFQVLKDLISGKYDHSLMNDHKDDFNNEQGDKLPSTEVVSRVIWERIQQHLSTLSNNPQCIQVIVRETPTSYVIFRPKEELI